MKRSAFIVCEVPNINDWRSDAPEEYLKVLEKYSSILNERYMLYLPWPMELIVPKGEDVNFPTLPISFGVLCINSYYWNCTSKDGITLEIYSDLIIDEDFTFKDFLRFSEEGWHLTHELSISEIFTSHGLVSTREGYKVKIK
jgi:hypothetical protein